MVANSTKMSLLTELAVTGKPSGQLVTFTNIVTLEEWRHSSTNGAAMLYQRGGPQFMNWASNQFAIYY